MRRGADFVRFLWSVPTIAANACVTASARRFRATDARSACPTAGNCGRRRHPQALLWPDQMGASNNPGLVLMNDGGVRGDAGWGRSGTPATATDRDRFAASTPRPRSPASCGLPVIGRTAVVPLCEAQGDGGEHPGTPPGGARAGPARFAVWSRSPLPAGGLHRLGRRGRQGNLSGRCHLHPNKTRRRPRLWWNSGLHDGAGGGGQLPREPGSSRIGRREAGHRRCP